MKKTIFLFSFLAIAFSQSAVAQYQTIFGSGRIEYSGFGGPMFNFTSIADKFAFMTGGGGAVLLNDKFFIGGYGMGVSNEPKTSVNQYRMDYGEGGFWFGVNLKPYKAVHVTPSLMTGWGSFTGNTDLPNGRQYSDDTFSITPNIEIEANVTQFMRVALGLNYRIVTGFDPGSFSDAGYQGLSSSDLNSPGVMLTFKFGWFGR